MNPSLPTSGPANQPVYWTGNDGNTYLKSAATGWNGQAVGAGDVPNVAKFATQIANPGGTNTGTSTGVSSGGGGSGSATDPTKIAAINNAYNGNAQFYQNELGQIGGNRSTEEGDANRVYDTQISGLQTQRDAAFANLDNQSRVANQSYGRSLQQLGNSIRNQYQGQSNQLGTQGAGDSSATGQLGYALGQQNNLQRSYMNQDLNNQLTQVGLTRDADQGQFQTQQDQIQALRKTQLDNIGLKYQQLTNQINGAYTNNDSARKMALNYAGQWAANQVGGIDPAVQTAINSAKTPLSTPTVAQSPMASYTAHNVVAPTVGAQSDLGRSNTVSAPETQIFSPYYKDTQSNLGF